MSQPNYVLMAYAEIAWVAHSNDNYVIRVIPGSDAIHQATQSIHVLWLMASWHVHTPQWGPCASCACEFPSNTPRPWISGAVFRRKVQHSCLPNK
jgi:hypothetical protein